MRCNWRNNSAHDCRCGDVFQLHGLLVLHVLGFTPRNDRHVFVETLMSINRAAAFCRKPPFTVSHYGHHTVQGK